MRITPPVPVATNQVLINYFEPCLVEVLTVLDAAANPACEIVGSASSLRESLLVCMDNAARQAAARFSTQTIVLARRFVTAWADERLSSDNWPDREAWRARPLQSEWGEGRTAGDWFFDALVRLEPTRKDDVCLAGLVVRCLALDFDGKMHYSRMELTELRRSTARRFGFDVMPVSFPPLSGDAAAGDNRNSGSTLWWLFPVLALLALSAAYFAADEHLNRHLESLLPVQVIEQALEK